MFPNLCTHSSRDLSHACITHSWTHQQKSKRSLTAHRLLMLAIRGCRSELVITPHFWNAYSYNPPNSLNAWGGRTIWVMGGLPLSSLDIPRFPFSRPHVHRARERVSRSQCLVRQVLRASSYITKYSLVDPNPPTPQLRQAKSLWSPCRINMSPSMNIRELLCLAR